jgi:hypothetical protein
VGGAVTLLHLCAVTACYSLTFTLGSAPLLAVGFVMRAACVVVPLVVSNCYVELDVCWCVCVCVCCVAVGGLVHLLPFRFRWVFCYDSSFCEEEAVVCRVTL